MANPFRAALKELTEVERRGLIVDMTRHVATNPDPIVGLALAGLIDLEYEAQDEITRLDVLLEES